MCKILLLKVKFAAKVQKKIDMDKWMCDFLYFFRYYLTILPCL